MAAAETLAAVPEHVLRALPEEVRLFPSAVDKTRIGESGVREGAGEGTAGCRLIPFGARPKNNNLYFDLKDYVVFMQ